jgi:hypothetical protein
MSPASPPSRSLVPAWPAAAEVEVGTPDVGLLELFGVVVLVFRRVVVGAVDVVVGAGVAPGVFWVPDCRVRWSYHCCGVY